MKTHEEIFTVSRPETCDNVTTCEYCGGPVVEDASEMYYCLDCGHVSG